MLTISIWVVEDKKSTPTDYLLDLTNLLATQIPPRATSSCWAKADYPNFFLHPRSSSPFVILHLARSRSTTHAASPTRIPARPWPSPMVPLPQPAPACPTQPTAAARGPASKAVAQPCLHASAPPQRLCQEEHTEDDIRTTRHSLMG